MVKSGMPLLDSLNLLRKQVKSKSFAYVLDKVTSDVESGQFLSQSLHQFSRLFGNLFINVIHIGEESGTLADNLIYLSSELQKKRLLRQKVRSAFIYPAIILIATLGVAGILIFFVMPRIIPIFTSLNIELPITTKILVAVATFLFDYGLWLLAGMISAVIIWILLLRIYVFKFFSHRLILLLPFFGSVVRMANTAEFTRTLALLLRSGMKIVESLNITADSMGNLVYKTALLEASEVVQRGESLHKYLSRNEKLFLPTVTRMIEVGDTTGTLESNLFYLADFYENEVDESTKNLSVVLEPAMLLVMGTIVGFVAIAIITPIYEITSTLRR